MCVYVLKRSDDLPKRKNERKQKQKPNRKQLHIFWLPEYARAPAYATHATTHAKNLVFPLIHSHPLCMCLAKNFQIPIFVRVRWLRVVCVCAVRVYEPEAGICIVSRAPNLFTHPTHSTANYNFTSTKNFGSSQRKAGNRHIMRVCDETFPYLHLLLLLLPHQHLDLRIHSASLHQ